MNITSALVEEQHLHMVGQLAKPGQAILQAMTPDQMHALHMAVGISGEAGEVLDIVKKIAVYQKPMTSEMRVKLVEELGDIEFYLRGLYAGTGISRQEALLHNMEKLGKRYIEGTYSDKAAQERADKGGQQFDPA